MRVDDEALVARITARSTCGDCGEVYNDITKPIPESGTCSNCGGTEFKRRADDNEESLKQRLKLLNQRIPIITAHSNDNGISPNHKAVVQCL